ESLWGARIPPTVSSPNVESVRPPALVQMLSKNILRVVDADGHDRDAVFPVGVFLPQRLQFSHGLLAWTTPRRPKIKHNNLAMQPGKFHPLVIVEPRVLDLRRRHSWRQCHILRDVVLQLQSLDEFLVRNAFWETLPTKITRNLPLIAITRDVA